MCGIAGIICIAGESPNYSSLELATSIMSKRGPDDASIWINNNIGLVHTRLSIIDLSTNAHQPMIREVKGKLAIVFNGEIYNFLAIRKELSSLGYAFNTHSDTETILIAYEAWGIERTLAKLDGMFAFCLSDINKNTTYLARDRFGKKPLYYAKENSKFLFCSDIRFVAKLIGDKSLNVNSVSYLLQELSMPQPFTIWNEIKQLEPGSYLKINTNSLDYHIERFFDFEVSKLYIDETEVMYETERLLNEAILKRMVSDVPVSCFLSGGIDSGLIVALLAMNSSARVNTFSIGFGNTEHNELNHARMVATKYHTNHTEINIESDVRNLVPEILNDMGEPFADSSLIPSYMITHAMKGKYKVALSGDGGDELFGYPNYLDIYHAEKFLQKNPNRFFRNMKVNSSKILSRISGYENLGKYNDFARQIDNGNLLFRQMAFSNTELSRLFNKNTTNFKDNYLKDIWDGMEFESISDKLKVGSFKSRLLNDYLVKIDRSSMMNSVEVRSPFLDIALARFCLNVPNSVHFQNNSPKYILKKLAKKYLDPDIEKRSKRGFSIPLKEWLRTDLRPFMMDVLNSNDMADHGLFDRKHIDSLIADFFDDSKPHSDHKIWSLVCFQYWYMQNGKV